ncbi:hypothetical protein TNCV_5119761 [Trichonephila clavipes]|nr:hypothetical protein TNCV_5119761 [Trichonephila clavipes]
MSVTSIRQKAIQPHLGADSRRNPNTWFRYERMCKAAMVGEKASKNHTPKRPSLQWGKKFHKDPLSVKSATEAKGAPSGVALQSSCKVWQADEHSNPMSKLG